MSDKFSLVRDVLDNDFILLKASKTVAESKDALDQAGKKYGVVVSPGGLPIGLVTAKALSSVSNFEISLGEFSELPALIVDGDVLLDHAISFSAQTLVESPGMLGLVIRENGKAVGILTRQTARKHSQNVDTRGGDITELAGNPQSRAKYFVCPENDYQELVIQYDPDNPPTCQRNHPGRVLIKQLQ